MQGGVKKEYRILDDKPVLIHAVLPFFLSESFYKIIITVPGPDISHVRTLISPYINPAKVEIIEGGSTRPESVYSGLKKFENTPPDIILVHDGARPWIKMKLIKQVLEVTERYSACIPVVEVPDALKEIDENGIIIDALSREKIKGAQTPQGFDYIKLYEAYKLARKRNLEALDDAEVYSLLYKPVMTVKGDVMNRKITYAHDL